MPFCFFQPLYGPVRHGLDTANVFMACPTFWQRLGDVDASCGTALQYDETLFDGEWMRMAH